MASARIIFLIVVIFTISILAQPSSRIWGGEEATKNSFAYVASVRLDGAHICGGSIIGSKSILTAAHCVVKNNNVVHTNRVAVRVGSTNQFSGGKLHYVSAISVHPNYVGVKNDIAVLTLELALEWTERVAMIKIALSSTDQPSAGDSVTVAGWGDQSTEVSSHKLHTMSFSIAAEEVCKYAFSGKDNSTICLVHDLKKGSCTGDAGNGAIYKNNLIGVNSFIVGACGSRYPDFFSSVVYYAPWIKDLIV